MELDVSTHSLVVAQLQQTNLGDGEISAENTQDPVRHLGEHHRDLDGEGGHPGDKEAGQHGHADAPVTPRHCQHSDLQ